MDHPEHQGAQPPRHIDWQPQQVTQPGRGWRCVVECSGFHDRQAGQRAGRRWARVWRRLCSHCTQLLQRSPWERACGRVIGVMGACQRARMGVDFPRPRRARAPSQGSSPVARSPPLASQVGHPARLVAPAALQPARPPSDTAAPPRPTPPRPPQPRPRLLIARKPDTAAPPSPPPTPPPQLWAWLLIAPASPTPCWSTCCAACAASMCATSSSATPPAPTPPSRRSRYWWAAAWQLPGHWHCWHSIPPRARQQAEDASSCVPATKRRTDLQATGCPAAAVIGRPFADQQQPMHAQLELGSMDWRSGGHPALPPCPLSQAGTYNVGGKKPPEGLRLHNWLGQQMGFEGALSPAAAEADAGLGRGGPDMICLGFQVGGCSAALAWLLAARSRQVASGLPFQGQLRAQRLAAWCMRRAAKPVHTLCRWPGAAAGAGRSGDSACWRVHAGGGAPLCWQRDCGAHHRGR